MYGCNVGVWHSARIWWLGTVGDRVCLLGTVKETTDFEGLLVTDLTPGTTKFCPSSTVPSSALQQRLPFRGINSAPGRLAVRSFDPCIPTPLAEPLMPQRDQVWISVGSASSLPSSGEGSGVRGGQGAGSPTFFREEGWCLGRLFSEHSTTVC